MKYIQYLQAGGQTKPSIKEQVRALVKAAISGDKKATAQVKQIMQAAQSGNQEAQQLAQLIQETIKELQQGQGVQTQQQGGPAQPQQGQSFQQQPQPQPRPQINMQRPGTPPPQQGNTSLGTQMFGDAGNMPLSKNDYGAPENTALDDALSGMASNFMNGAASAIGSMQDGGEFEIPWARLDRKIVPATPEEVWGIDSVEVPVPANRIEEEMGKYILSPVALASNKGFSYVVNKPRQLLDSEMGIVRMPRGNAIRRNIAHGLDGVSDTVYVTQNSKHEGTLYEPTPYIRYVIDKKLDATPMEWDYQDSFKRGGKVRSSKKNVMKKAKGGCPCVLKRVGGKLIEINTCTSKQI